MLMVGVEPPDGDGEPPDSVVELWLLLPPQAATANATITASGNAAHGRMYLLTVTSLPLGAQSARLV
jgi:hypothetical protein